MYRLPVFRFHTPDHRILFSQQDPQASRVDILGYRRKCVVKVRQHDSFRPQSCKDPVSFPFEECAPLIRHHQKIRAGFVVFLIIQVQASQDLDPLSFRFQLIDQSFPVLLEFPVCPYKEREVQRGPEQPALSVSRISRLSKTMCRP